MTSPHPLDVERGSVSASAWPAPESRDGGWELADVAVGAHGGPLAALVIGMDYDPDMGYRWRIDQVVGTRPDGSPQIQRMWLGVAWEGEAAGPDVAVPDSELPY